MSGPDSAPTTLRGPRPPIAIVRELSFLGLAVLVLAGTRPFEHGDIQRQAMSSRGSAFETVLYLSLTLLCILTCLPRMKLSHLRRLYLWFGVLTIWCAMSLTWSLSINEAAARFGQYLLVSCAVMGMVAVVPAQRLVHLFALALGMVILVDLASLLLSENAVHRFNEPREALVGAWKGLHIHKNYAGAVAGLAALVFLLRSFHLRRLSDLVMAGLSLLFLFGTGSRTSIFLTIPVPLALIILHMLFRFIGSSNARALSVLAAIIIAALSAVMLRLPGAVLDSNATLTGRVELWNAMLAYAQAHLLTGSGFGSFWRVGDSNPILSLTWGWGTRTGQGHNGYLDILVTLGAPGLVLTLITFVVAPMALLPGAIRAGGLALNTGIALLLFSLVHNLTESSLLVGNHPVFFALLLGVTLLARGEPR